jgi:hypothetical protein
MEMKGFEHSSNSKKETPSAQIKTKLLAVSELNAKKIEQMTDERMNTYIDALIAFAEGFQAQETGLRSSVKIRQYTSAFRWLVSIAESLSRIYADDLLEDCQNQIKLNKDINSVRHEKLENFINFFLSNLSMLAADLEKLNLPLLKQLTKHLAQNKSGT